MNKKGQSLIEVLISVTVSIIVLWALVNLAVGGLANTKSSLARAQANRIASAAIEGVRIVRDIEGLEGSSFNSPTEQYMIYGGVLMPCQIINPVIPEASCGNPASSNCIGFGSSYQDIYVESGSGVSAKMGFCRSIYISDVVDAKRREIKVEVAWNEGPLKRKINLSSELYEK